MNLVSKGQIFPFFLSRGDHLGCDELEVIGSCTYVQYFRTVVKPGFKRSHNSLLTSHPPSDLTKKGLSSASECQLSLEDISNLPAVTW